MMTAKINKNVKIPWKITPLDFLFMPKSLGKCRENSAPP